MILYVRHKLFCIVDLMVFGRSGPDLSQITTIHGNPNLIAEESERITKLIQEGGKFAAAKKAPAGMRRRTRLVRRHHKPRE